LPIKLSITKRCCARLQKHRFERSPNKSDILVDKAVAIALEGRPGPVMPISRSALSAPHRPAARLRGPPTRTALPKAAAGRSPCLVSTQHPPSPGHRHRWIHEEGGGASIRDFAEQATRQKASFPKTAHHRAAATAASGRRVVLGLATVVKHGK
jgi:hypothetical protein